MQFVDGLGPNFVDGRFKMRHAQGRQATKFCQLIFDRIDKIMYNTDIVDVTFKPPVDLSKDITGFTRHRIRENIGENKEKSTVTRGKPGPEQIPPKWAEFAASFDALSLKTRQHEEKDGTIAAKDKYQGEINLGSICTVFEAERKTPENTELGRRLEQLATAELTKMENGTTKIEKSGKALLHIMGTISSRPQLEPSCERHAWGTIPKDEKNLTIRKIYPNKNAPSRRTTRHM